MKKTIKKEILPQKRLKTAGVIAAVIGLMLIAWFLMRNTSVYSRDKVAVQNDVGHVLESVQLPGSITYSDFKDHGCDAGNSVGLAYYIHCEVRGHKLAKNNGALHDDLHTIDAALKKLGFRPRTFANGDSSNREKALDGQTTNAMVSYVRDDKNPDISVGVDLSFYKGDGTANDSYVSPLIQSGSITKPQNNEYIYGIRVEASYFSCRGGSIFQLPCPSAPSPIDLQHPEF